MFVHEDTAATTAVSKTALPTTLHALGELYGRPRFLQQ